MHEDSPRLYSCLNCRCLIIICRNCDRGNRYCRQCSPIMFLKSKQRANKRYQSSYKGRLNHAARQKRYRERLKRKVTYQGCKVKSARDLLVNKQKCVKMTFTESKKPHSKDVFCRCCGEICSPFLRSDWVRYSVRKKSRVEIKAKKLVFGCMVSQV